MKFQQPLRNWGGSLVILCLLLYLTLGANSLEPLLGPLAPENAPAIYARNSFIDLVGWHLLLVLIAISAAAVIAILAALFVSRPVGADFLPLARSLANLGQTLPPVAVLALAVPAVGFGSWPTLIALFLYGLLPIFENTLAGLGSVPTTVKDAARGLGMSPLQRFWQVELPLALPLIITGIRLSVIISIGTATIGSTVAAKGLGEVIIAGILTDNLAFVLHGGLIVALMAMLLDGLFVKLERRFATV
ncbi:ABC transporter permease [Marinobacterium mangrovicola]|uniref:Osmoprotectant transport system permease protein n=1 Tax=Marinobacterium mangrovicola TaxID=1476959 RepID=A0A4R1GPN7_9GAMM|nr:ABC transporter permease [Marinobacterium mangrovicola]TCK09303.1 osmoprotectant transport system permease protein [Marinobacterium mangrovicola]